MTRPAPLHGIRVVDLTQVLAGPYCTYQLALLGAEVIKIEPPSGEFTRRGGDYQGLEEQGLGLSYCTQNADKQTVSLDLKAAGAIDAVLNLVRDADIFVQNYRPGVAERLGLGIDAVKAANPKIVHCSIFRLRRRRACRAPPWRTTTWYKRCQESWPPRERQRRVA